MLKKRFSKCSLDVVKSWKCVTIKSYQSSYFVGFYFLGRIFLELSEKGSILVVTLTFLGFHIQHDMSLVLWFWPHWSNVMYESGSGLPQSIGTWHDQHILRPAVGEHIDATIQIRANVASIVSTQTIWIYWLVARHKHVGFNPHLWHNTVMHISTDKVIGSLGRSISVFW